ncbi:uncharacterized protein LOC126252324 [Schistocerca nitens]|uniref:uncharacterized protein LOC126252324 n=1 Tax=Schistocerca nitens TaxID=7011 RepID=UPI0021180039|nr:uncharacterized protein LOC126252324 [Schistocerca nitens]
MNPTVLKMSVMKLVYKKGSKEDVSNYRPISLIPTFSKIFESIILSQLSDFFTKHKLLKMQTAGIFLDLTRAFDMVNHRVLLKKIKSCSTGDQAMNLLTTIPAES